MEPVRRVEGIAVPLPRPDVDTDQIIPKDFLKRIERTGYGRFLFHSWRFREDGTPRPDFVLNRPEYAGARILVAGPNFGCGSSREHACWALADFGFGVVIAPSLADIFENNCYQNAMVPVVLDGAVVDEIVRRIEDGPGRRLTVDLDAMTVSDDGGVIATFELDAFRRECLLNGWDDITRTLRWEDEITAFEKAHEAGDSA